MTNETTPTLGMIAFGAYKEYVEGKTYDGKTIPKWEDLTDKVRQAWHVAAWAVVDEVKERTGARLGIEELKT